MTQVIDGRVVEMKFDNSDFEKNVAQSMSTLEKLKAALNFDSAKELQSIGKVSKNFDLGGVGTAVETVQAKFSALQVIGMTALSEITKSAMNLGATLINKVISPIKTGGMNRALNIEQAKFQLKGLGVAWKDIEDDINYGVKDTAYGLDAAAKAASQFAASGVQLGDDMKAALRGISGVAAMTNSTYEDIADVFTAVSGKGKAMASEFNRLGARGLNAKAAVADFLNGINDGTIETDENMKAMVKDITGGLQVTEQDIAEFASKSKINFDIFSKALDNAFGAHAKAANETFTGAMSNVRAALSRIGANFATPYMENMRLIAIEAIGLINKVNKMLNPIYDEVSRIMGVATTGITDFLKSANALNSVRSIVVSIRNAYYGLLLVLEPIKEAFYEIFPKKEAGEGLRAITLAIERFVRTLVISEENADRVKRTFKGLFAALDIVKMAFSAAFEAIKPFSGGVGDVISALLNGTASIGDYIVKLRDSIKENNTFGKIFGRLASVIQAAAKIIKGGLRGITDGIKSFKETHIDTKDFSGITSFFERLKDRFKSFSGLGDIIKTIFDGIAGAFKGFKPIASAIGELVSSLVGGVLQGFNNAFGGNKLDAFSTFINMLSSATAASMMMRLANALSAIGKAAQTGLGLNPLLTTLKTNFLNVMTQIQADIKADVLVRIGKAIALFAGSLFVMSMINPASLAGATVALGVILYMMNQMLVGFNKLTTLTDSSMSFVTSLKTQINNFSTSINSLIRANALKALAGALLEISVAVGILSLAINAIAKLRPEQAFQGLGVILTLMAALYLMAEKFNDKNKFTSKSIMQGASQLVLIAVAVKVLASAVKSIGKLDPAQAIQGLVGVAAIMTAITAMLTNVDGKKMGAGTGLAFIETAAAVLLIGKAVASLGSLPEDQILQGMTCVGLLMGAIALIGKLFDSSDTAGAVGAGFALIEMAVALNLIAAAIGNVGSMGVDEVTQGLVALGAALLAFSVILGGLSELTVASDLIATAASLAIVGVAVNLIAGAISTLASQDPMNVVLSLLALAAAIGAFIVAAVLAQPVIGMLLSFAGTLALFGVSVLALGAGLLILSAAVAAFNAIGPQFVDVLLGLAIGLGAFAVAAMVLQPVLVPMALLAGVLALIGAAALITGAGLMVVGMGLSTIAAVGVAGAAAIETVAVALLAISAGCVAFSLAIGTLSLSMVAFIATLALFVASVGLATTMMTLFGVSTGVSAAALTVYSLAAGIASAATLVLATSLSVLFGVLGSVFPIFDEIVTSIEGTFNSVVESVTGAVDNLKDSISGKADEMIELGKNFILGFLKGLTDVPILGSIVKAGANIAAAAIDAVKKKQDSNSPSWVTHLLGVFFGEGYADGITESQDGAEQAATNTAAVSVEALKDGSADSYDIGALTSEGYGEGLLDSIPGVKDAAEQVKNAGVTPLKEGAAEAGNYTSTIEAYRMRYGNSTKYVASQDERLKKKSDELNGVTRENTKATNDATEAQNKYGDALGKTGKKAKEEKDFLTSLNDTLSSQMDIFSKFEIKTEVSADQMLENMKSNLDGYASWSHRLAVLTERGINKDLWEKLAEMGPKGYETLNAFVQMTDDQLKQANEMFTASMAMDDAVMAEIIPSYKKLGGDIPKGLVEGLKSRGHEVVDENKEMMKEGVEAAKEEVKSNSPSLVYKELGKDCMDGFRLGLMDPSVMTFIEDCIHLLFNQITGSFEEEFGGEAFKQVGSKALKSLVENTFAEGGSMSVEGFANAFLEFSLINTNITAFCEQVRSLVEGQLKVSETSRSEVFYNYGRQSVLGFANGITNNLSNVRVAISTLASFVRSALNAENLTSDFYNTGKNATLGFANGIADSEAASKVTAEAKKIADEAVKTMKDALKEKSPSRITEQIGLFASKGLAIGIADGARNVYNAAKSVAEGTANTFDTYGTRIQDLIDASLDFNPVITPLLDLSLVRQQLSELDAMFTSRAESMGIGQNGGQFTGNPTQQINFTQNNYSPKALSRYEIYRDTKNQLNMMKGVVKANA